MPINEEYIFTYDDYLALTQLDGLISVAEEDAEYKIEGAEAQMENAENQGSDIEKILNRKGIPQKHDKSFKDILADKKEMAFFLREFVDIEVEAEELQEYKTEFITKQYERRQSDIIYKNIKKDIYYIVEHQSKKDKNMPFRMAEYCMELMKQIIKNSNSELYPVIVPIVLYTGNGSWNVKTNFSERQRVYESTYEKYKIDIKYTVVDINKIEDKELLEKQDYLANIMLLEKCKTFDKSVEMFNQIQNYTKDMNQIYVIENFVINVLWKNISPDVKENLIKNFKWRDSNMMMMFGDINKQIKDSRREGRREGKKEGIAFGILENLTATIKNMLKYNEDDEKIMKYTNAKKEDIDRVRRELGMQVN